MQNTFFVKALYLWVFLVQNIKVRSHGIDPFRKILKRSLNRYQFNPSTVILRDQCFTVWREVDKDGVRQLYLGKEKVKGKTFEVYNLGEKIKSQDSSIKWVGDARLFLRHEKLNLVFDTGHAETPNRMFIVVLDESGCLLSNVKEAIKVDGRNSIEKNWNFFVENEKLYAIYSHQPLQILELINEDNEIMKFCTVVTHNFSLKSSSKVKGEIRGTSAPIRLDNVYISTTHSSFPTNKGLVYQSHFFVFNSIFPFSPISFSTRPIHYGAASKLFKSKQKLNRAVHQVEFPSGAFVLGQDMILGFGLNDYKVGVKVLRLSKVLSQSNSILN